MYIIVLYLLQQVEAIQYQSHIVLSHDECNLVFEQQTTVLP